MNTKVSSKERGQSLVLVALASVALVAAVALSVDGGNAYNQRRVAQNAADAGAVAGTYEVYQQHKSPANTWNEVSTRMKINEAAEEIGIADTNGIAGDAINDNIQAFFTDESGDVVRNATGDPCIVNGGNCGGNGQAKWGIRVVAVRHFPGYFSSIIGWDTLKVQAGAVSVTHRGAEVNDEQFALFADYQNNACNQPYPVHVSGATVNITGNVHSNTSVKITGSSTTISQGALSYVVSTQCGGPCPGQPILQLPDPITHFVYPDHDRIKSLVLAQSQAYRPGNPPSGYYATGQSVRNGETMNFGSEARPYTYINGDFEIKNGGISQLYGIIYVNGDVTINPDQVTVHAGPAVVDTQICGGPQGMTKRLSIVASGTIKITQGQLHLDAAPFIDPSFNELKDNTIMFFSNYTATSCSPTIDISGESSYFRGSIIAPRGGISVSGSRNVIVGAVIGNTIDISGSQSTIEYRPECSPPQPDWIELVH